ncbi:RagB/SusD family nutrient uptake outer membrane protein [uncultured Chryseobacterium sp.]|uniref:RagB/SusD family nutrient uptake outer membrane protein n=1 Tax=uncultured Chryseobacterium sp. TaxID=259322 RepID=UPI002629AB86|nr:RagB/SusD family nutrient uptake outer membrane protein [uncultured Chryseobacterium sp.]
MTLQSCREEYLNEPAPTASVSPDVVFGSKEGANAFMAGILRRTRGQFTATDAGNLGSMYFARTNKGNDVINAASWFGFDYANDNREPTYRRTVFTWNFLYYIINQVNAFIKGVEESTEISADDKNELLGQAYAMRAFMYFELSMEFQHTYTYDTALPAPPIYNEPNALEGNPMSTQKEMYDFIVSDIEHAISIGSTNRINKSYFNKTVAYAVGARIYQVMGNWAKAAQYANLAYGGSVSGALQPAAYSLGFDDMDENKEWLLADPQTSDQSAYYYLAPHGFFTMTESAYNNTYINKTLVALFTATDVRNTFAKTTRTDYRQWYTKKFKFAFDADVPLIRTAEMILIEAESLYRSGNEAGAKSILYQLQKNRDASAVQSANTGAALLNEILVERRKELYGEIGIEWYDAKRLRKGLPRDSWHRLNLATNPMMPDDKRFFLKIPQAEIDANPNIDDTVNSNR